MHVSRRLLLQRTLIAAALSIVLSASAFADTVIKTYSYNTSGPAGMDPLNIKPFDPSLGTLKDVSVDITGLAFIAVQTVPDYVPCGPIVCPMPTPFTVQADQDFFGLFTFTNSAEYLTADVASGAGETHTYVIPYEYQFQFNAGTDLLGFAVPTVSGFTIPPLGVDATRESFEASPGGFYLLNTSFTVTATGDFVLPPTDVSTNGALTIRYDYLPTIPAPEPASLLLLSSGVLALRSVTRRR